MEKKAKKPPFIARFLLKRLSGYNCNYEINGDIEEEFAEKAEKAGNLKARFWFWKQALGTISSYSKYTNFWSFIMFKSYLKITCRSIKRQKINSLINITGLTLGFTAFILIFLYIRYELSFENFHKNADNIYRVIMHQENNFFQGTDWHPWTPPILAPTLKADIPEINTIARYENSKALITHEDKINYEEDFCYVDPEFFDIFTFKIIKGDPRSALREPYTVFVTEEMAVKYFGNEDPVGKIIRVDRKNDFTIVGIVENCPPNTHIRFNFISSFISHEKINGSKEWYTRWGNNHHDTYLILPENSDPDEIEEKLRKYDVGTPVDVWGFHIWRLMDIHLKGIGNRPGESDIRYIYVFSATAVFLILLASFNYMNLSTAISFLKAKEIGIRKVAGANRYQLIKQFLGESMLFSFTALCISIFLVYFLLPVFNSFIGIDLSFSVLEKSWNLPGMLILTFIIGLLSGSYPAFFMSSFKPVNTIKGKFRSGSGRSAIFRNSIVVTQFVITIALLISTIIVFQQMQFIRNKKLGFDQEHIVQIPLDRSRTGGYDSFKNELVKNYKIVDATISDSPVGIGNKPSIRWEGRESDGSDYIFLAKVDYNFFDFYNIEIVEGRKFSEKNTTDRTAFILNEAALRIFGLENVVGKQFRTWDREGSIIGIVKDFHFKSLHLPIYPLAIGIGNRNSLFVKINENITDLQNTISYIENKYKEFFPEHPFNYSFLDERIARLYDSERKMGTIFNTFTYIAIFIACMGLFGMISYISERRTKEIGLRKVLGAPVYRITCLLSGEFVKLVLLANVISWPIAWFFMQKWLRNFSYKIDISLWMFFSAGLIALVITILTVGYRSIKAAITNPVDSLRYE